MENLRPAVPVSGIGARRRSVPAGQPHRRRPQGRDIVLSVALLALCIVGESAYREPTWWEILLSVAMCTPLVWRRSHPEGAAVVVLGVQLLQMLTVREVPLFADVAILFVVYRMSADGRDRARPVVLLGALLAVAVWVLRYSGSSLNGPNAADNAIGFFVLFGFIVALVLLAWGLGVLRRSQRARVEALQERVRLVEVEREQQLRLLAQAERTRIARDLHDVVAHSLAVMITQADGGRYAARSNPDSAVHALETIAETGRAALSEMRQLLGVLRDEVPAAATTAPQPGLGDLTSLVEGLRSGGLAVTLESHGPATALPQGMGLAAYRIVQEGLTNVLKHVGPQATAQVHLWWSPSALTIDVVDDGRGAVEVAPGDGPGHGLLGMRERAALYSGSVQAGPLPTGGFGVRAVFPLAAKSAAMPGVGA